MIILLGLTIYIVLVFLTYYVIQKWFKRNFITYDYLEFEDESMIWSFFWPLLLVLLFLVIIVYCVQIPFKYMFSKIKELAERK